jgi:hypothetical protein
MIFQKTFKKYIPSHRHKKVSVIWDYTVRLWCRGPVSKNNQLLQKKKKIYKKSNYVVSSKIYRNNNLVTLQPVYNTKPYKKFFVCKTLDNLYKIIPGIEKLNIGKTLFNYTSVFLNPYRLYSRGVAVPLHKIPLTCYITNISNQLNTKITFAKSSGSFCRTQKSKKTKQKLTLIILPSKKRIHLPKYCMGYIGKMVNFRVNKLTEGSWGFSFTQKKHINVRGVAMNPVDHPNGGRAKTVQPERSPWN